MLTRLLQVLAIAALTLPPPSPRVTVAPLAPADLLGSWSQLSAPAHSANPALGDVEAPTTAHFTLLPGSTCGYEGPPLPSQPSRTSVRKWIPPSAFCRWALISDRGGPHVLLLAVTPSATHEVYLSVARSNGILILSGTPDPPSPTTPLRFVLTSPWRA